MAAANPAPALTAVLPTRIRARWDRIALEQLAARAAELDEENESLAYQLTEAEHLADFWQHQIERAEDEGAKFALTQDGQLYQLQAAS